MTAVQTALFRSFEKMWVFLLFELGFFSKDNSKANIYQLQRWFAVSGEK